MANILFKRGQSSALDSLKAQGKIIDGAFYLTEDTHRLYAGIGSNGAEGATLVDLNKYIRTYADLETLKRDWKNAKEGDFAYITEGNILATYTTPKGESAQRWIQINPDTNVDTSLYQAKFAKTTTDNKTIKVTLALQEKDINGEVIKNADNTVKEITTFFELTSEDIAAIATDIAVDLEADVTGGVATLAVGGTGADNTGSADKVTIKGVGAVAVSKGENKNEIVITGTDTNTTYDLLTKESTTHGEIVLKDSDNGEDIVKVNGADAWIDVTSDDKGNINITHTGPSAGSLVTSTPSGDSGNISKTSPKFTAVVSVEADSKGHITGVKTTEFTLPDSDFDLDITEKTLTVKNGEQTIEKKYTTQVHLQNSNDQNIGDAAINTAHKITIDGINSIVENGGDLGSFYSAGEIDKKFKAVDAMVYGGTVGSAEEVQTKVTEGVSIGDTFKASAKFTLNGITVEPGDILIANSTTKKENAETGKIDVDNVTWDHIASGADTDTTYELKGRSSDNAIVLDPSAGTESKIVVTDDDHWIKATVTETELNIEHELIERSDDSTKVDITNRKFTAIVDVASDDAGHVTGVTTSEFTIADMSNKLKLTGGETPQFDLIDADDVVLQSVKFVDTEKIDIDGEISADGKILTIDAKHATLEVTETSDDEEKSVPLNGNGSITAITDVNYDDYGHITEIVTSTFNIEAETNTTYDLGVTSTGEGTATITLTDSNNGKDQVNITSNNLTLTSTQATNGKENGSINIDFVWGTFN